MQDRLVRWMLPPLERTAPWRPPRGAHHIPRMRVTRTPGRLELRQTPGCLWSFGMWFVAGGALCLGMVAFRGDGLATWERLVGAIIGSGVLAGGLHFMGTTAATTLVFDRERRRVTYERRAPLRRRVVVEVAAEDFLGYRITESADSDGDAWAELNVLFAGQPPLLLDSVSGGAREYLQQTALLIDEARRDVLPARRRR